MSDEKTTSYYGDKVILITGGSIGSELCRQLAKMNPKRVIRYFMTIPEASQLVLESGAMGKNGELFVLDMGQPVKILDMGQPVKILDLAESMIRLSGVNGIEIVQTGLRPGEKLYGELLVKTETLTKTDNSLIFIEKDAPLPKEELEQRLHILETACESGSDDAVRRALKQVVPTYRSPEEVNANAGQTEEMNMGKEPATV